MLHPVISSDKIATLGIGNCTCDVADDLQRRPSIVQLGCNLTESFQHLLHVGRVEGVRDGESRCFTSLRLEVGTEGVCGGSISRYHRLRRCVQPRDVDASLQSLGQLGERIQDLRLGGLQRGHRAATNGELVHQPSTGAHQRRGIFEGQHLGHVGCHQLADGVTHKDIGVDSPGLPLAEQGCL